MPLLGLITSPWTWIAILVGVLTLTYNVEQSRISTLKTEIQTKDSLIKASRQEIDTLGGQIRTCNSAVEDFKKGTDEATRKSLEALKQAQRTSASHLTEIERLKVVLAGKNKGKTCSDALRELRK